MGANKILSKKKCEEWRSAREARIFASTNCVHYQKCRDEAAYANRQMQCHKCEQMKVDRDTWQKEVSLANISRSGEGEQSVKVEEISCPVGEGRKKIMEKQVKDERPTSNVEHQTPNEKNPGTISIEDLPGPKSKGELETRVCSQADCEFGGEPQPIDNFRRNPRYPEKRFKKCNSCVSKLMQAGQRRRQERLREEKKEGKKVGRLEGRTPVQNEIGDERPTSPRLNRKEVSRGKNVEHRTSNEMPGPLQERIEIPELMPLIGDRNLRLLETRVLEALLDGLPDVFDKIVEIARDQERTPKAQARYLLKTDCRICGERSEGGEE